MGGTKKKSISQAEKAQAVGGGRLEKKGKDSKLLHRARREPVAPRIEESQAKTIFGPLKAITISNTAKTLNIKASIASSLLKSLEAKGILRKFGGYSGHFVYELNKK
jgi:small subunit ribosomal protein S25e